MSKTFANMKPTDSYAEPDDITPVTGRVESLEARAVSVENRASAVEVRMTSSENRLTNLESGKVDKVDGKVLSSNDFTNADKSKLDELHNYDDSVVRDAVIDHEGDGNAHPDIRQSITSHLVDCAAHPDIRNDLTNHEMDVYAHPDIRSAITTHESDSLAHPDIRAAIANHEGDSIAHPDIRADIASKQDVLTAGTGISIIGNVISSGGAGGRTLLFLSQCPTPDTYLRVWFSGHSEEYVDYPLTDQRHGEITLLSGVESFEVCTDAVLQFIVSAPQLMPYGSRTYTYKIPCQGKEYLFGAAESPVVEDGPVKVTKTNLINHRWHICMDTVVQFTGDA